MKKIILGLMILLSTSLFATDVSNFDIKGIKLGMSKDEVLKLMPHGIKFGSNCVDDKCKYPYEYYANYHWDQSNGKIYFNIDFDHNIKAYDIVRTIKLTRHAKIEKVAKNIINHYGKPDLIRKFRQIQVLCYGQCSVSKEADIAYSVSAKNNAKAFVVVIDMRKNIRENDVKILSMKLYDDKAKILNYKYRQKIEKKLEDIESKVDF
ncbi:hypothetical protein [Sulfurimonas sp.]